jgi:hypothetical protein
MMPVLKSSDGSDHPWSVLGEMQSPAGAFAVLRRCGHLPAAPVYMHQTGLIRSGGTNEYCMESFPLWIKFLQNRDVQIYFKAIHLSTKCITLDGDIHQAQEGLVAMRVF